MCYMSTINERIDFLITRTTSDTLQLFEVSKISPALSMRAPGILITNMHHHSDTVINLVVSKKIMQRWISNGSPILNLRNKKLTAHNGCYSLLVYREKSIIHLLPLYHVVYSCLAEFPREKVNKVWICKTKWNKEQCSTRQPGNQATTQ